MDEPRCVADDRADRQVEGADRRDDRRGPRSGRRDVGLDGDAEAAGLGRQGHGAQCRAGLDERPELVGEGLLRKVGPERHVRRRKLRHERHEAAPAVGQAQVERLLDHRSGLGHPIGREVRRASLGHASRRAGVGRRWGGVRRRGDDVDRDGRGDLVDLGLGPGSLVGRGQEGDRDGHDQQER